MDAANFVSKIDDSNLEHCFINSAFLSELWAARDIETKISNGLIAKTIAQAQLDDEYRHAEALFKLMTSLGFQPNEDVKFSMQNILYSSVLKIELSDCNRDKDFFWGIHEITERRAIINYKSYILGGTIVPYKKLLRVIINDEKEHFKKIDLKNSVVKRIYELDRFLHKEHLYKHYNKMDLLRSKKFWVDYFSNKIIQAQL